MIQELKDYKKILEGVVNIIATTEKTDIGFANICSYLSDNCVLSEDVRIRKALIELVKYAKKSCFEILKDMPFNVVSMDAMLAWLEKQVEQKSGWDEEDERIRKELIDAIQGLWDNDALPLPLSVKRKNEWLAWLEKQGEPVDKGEISDGFHTFNELYYYRMLYNAAFFNMLPKEWVHKSKKHNDGEECFGGGSFIVMANLPTGQISNHYELKDWDLFQIPEKERADKWDGHTPQEAAERLHNFLLEKQGEKKSLNEL